MSYTTPQLDACDAVASMLTGRTIADYTITASSGNLIAKYDLPDLESLKIDVVPSPDTRMTRENRVAVIEDCPVIIGVQTLCGDEATYRRLLALLRGIAKAVALVPTSVGLPTDDVEVSESPTAVDEDGRFYAVVAATYQVVTEAD